MILPKVIFFSMKIYQNLSTLASILRYFFHLALICYWLMSFSQKQINYRLSHCGFITSKFIKVVLTDNVLIFFCVQ